jgi:hypothetical protein
MSTRTGPKTSIGAYADPLAVAVSYRKRVKAGLDGAVEHAVRGRRLALRASGGKCLTARVSAAGSESSTPPPMSLDMPRRASRQAVAAAIEAGGTETAGAGAMAAAAWSSWQAKSSTTATTSTCSGGTSQTSRSISTMPERMSRRRSSRAAPGGLGTSTPTRAWAFF